LNGNGIIIANIGWSTDYLGRRVASDHGYVVEHGTGVEAYNFRPTPYGEFFGYIRGAAGFAKMRHERWTIVFVSKPRGEAGLRIVGWYEDAKVDGYRPRPEYDSDDNFPRLPNEEMYIFTARARKAFLVPPEDRALLLLPKGHPIKSGGIYYASGIEVRSDTKAQQAQRRALADWVRNTLDAWRSRARLIPATTPIPLLLDGVEIGEDGVPYGYSPVAETEDHKQLRVWAQNNPATVTGRTDIPAGETEVPLDSGDRVDVTYRLNNRSWVVEVKSWRSPESDHYRGIFQCVKYRAVREATEPDLDEVIAILVTQKPLSETHAALLRRLDILSFVAPKDIH
jgi:hypothetical protein